MKKVIIIVVALLIIFSVGFFVVKHYSVSEPEEDFLSTEERDILILSESFPTRILIYGEMLEFDEKITTEIVSEITYESLKKPEEFEYQLIIVNDLDNKSDLTMEEWNIINDVIREGIYINFMYLGDGQFEEILEAKLVEGKITYFEKGDLSVGLFYEGETAISVYGSVTPLTSVDQNSICKAVMREQVYSMELGME